MVNLDGTWINDIPSFYLALGKAINGLNGYIGGDLDALSDCLYGGFGVLPPLTVYLTRYEEVRKALDCRAWCRFHAESFQEAVRRGEKMEALVDWGYLGNGTPLDIERWTAKYEAALTGEPFDCDELGSYFDAILGVFERSGAKLVSN
jgi:RNAse (barnase) inhibitor barstar